MIVILIHFISTTQEEIGANQVIVLNLIQKKACEILIVFTCIYLGIGPAYNDMIIQLPRMDFLESKLKHEISFGNNPKSFIKNYTLLADSSLTRLVIMCIPWLWIIRMSPAQIFVCEIHNIHGTV